MNGIRTVKGLVAAAGLIASMASLPCSAHTIDTGSPDGSPVGAYLLDSTDFYAGQISFGGSSARVQNIFGHVLGGAAGETFTIALYADAANHLPGNEVFSSKATFGADGWNGISGLDWNVGPGLYWVAFEVAADDTLDPFALLDRGAPQPLTRTAFDAGGGYQASATPLSFGLQVDALVVPEPGSMALLFGGMGALVTVVRRRRR